MNQHVTNTRRGNFAAPFAAALPLCLLLIFCLSAFSPPDPPKGCSGRCKSSSVTPKADVAPGLSVTPMRTGPDSAPVKADTRVIIHEASHSEAVHTGAVVRPGATNIPDKKTKQTVPDRAPLSTEKGEMPASSPVMVTLFV